ncbi:hypothetical protein DWB68_10140 [Galactobacter valiniphilus]|uniref:DUF3168 domain-containing protein n=1 Tax=Galactobacter valiniphilus TaxID=2676122 RepID=A0A399JBG5_9MICC|nr:hypothetical protein [Galactobacter valiniphilus]RII41877.1 hypothetical protein DWB68_10140 [Galactobacter valiniphilus]
MADPSAIVMAVLQGVPGLTGGVYDGQVPDTIPTTGQGKFVKPYAVLWAGTGDDIPAERDLTRLSAADVLDWRPQVTVVGPSGAVCRDGARAVLAALRNLHVGGGWLIPDADHNRQLSPIPDNTVTPVRMFMPLRFRLVTTQ